jgi:hypothetical protein
MKMPFGRYRGMEIRDLPDEYFDWLLSIDLREPLASAVDREASCRFGYRDDDEEDEPDQSHNIPEPEVLNLANKIISTGYKRLATRLHPDAGGDHGDMVLLNAANSLLRSCLQGLPQ